MNFMHWVFAEFWAKKIYDLCEECGFNKCPYWPDPKILEDLYLLDKTDKGNRVDEYLKTRHEPYFSYHPITDECKVRCSCIDFRKHEICDYTNDDLAKKLFEEFKESIKSFDPPTTHCEICGNLKTIQFEETSPKTYCWTCPPTE